MKLEPIIAALRTTFPMVLIPLDIILPPEGLKAQAPALPMTLKTSFNVFLDLGALVVMTKPVAILLIALNGCTVTSQQAVSS